MYSLEIISEDYQCYIPLERRISLNLFCMGVRCVLHACFFSLRIIIFGLFIYVLVILYKEYVNAII